MKNNLFLLIALLSFSLSFSQTERANYKTAITEFQSHYNRGDFVSVFNMLNANFQKTLTLAKTKSFIKNNLNAKTLGKMKAVEFKNTIRTGHYYKLIFESGQGNAFLLLDSNNQISGFQISSK